MPTTENTRRTLDMGPTGRTVRANVARIRKASGITAEQLVKTMTQQGHKMPRTAISDIEGGYRKVGVDDLMALAAGLGVNPNGLLTPESESDQQRVEITGHGETVASGVLWGWMRGKNCLNPFDDQFIFRRRTMPRWLVEQEESATRVSELRNAQVQSLLDELAKRVSNGDS